MNKEYGMLLEKRISVNDNESLTFKLKNKDILKEKILCDFSDLNQVISNYDIKNINGEAVFKYSTYIPDIKEKRNHPSITVNFNNLDLSEYNQFCVRLKFICSGFVNFYVHFSFYSGGKEYTHTHSVPANKYEDVVWELNKEKLDSVSKFNILIFVMGTTPEGEKEVSVAVDKVIARKTSKEYEEGWELDNRIAYSHIGYLVGKEKKALIDGRGVCKAYLCDEKDNVVYDILFTHKNGVCELDFSDFKKEGLYKIKTDSGICSKEFLISKNIYDECIIKSMNFFKSLRCGEVVDGVHSACHLYSKTIHPHTKQTVPNFGGWHDAGDLSQFEICTAEMTSALCDLALAVKDNDLKDRIIDEAYIGASWLLRTRFGDGYRANTVLYRTWHSNVLEDCDKSVNFNEAEEGPFENFISSEALSKMVKIARSEEYKEYCLKAAIEDFKFGVYEYDNGIYTRRWGKSMDSQTGGALLSAASSLYEITNDNYYLDICSKYYKKVLATQEVNTSLDLYGYFYEDGKHEYILAYEHRGHDQSPICGIVNYYNVCTDEMIKNELYKSMMLYSEFIKKSVAMNINDYKLLPAGVFHEDKINLEHYTAYGFEPSKAMEILKGQVKTGKDVGYGFYLRNFPISITRRGFHATLLSKTKGVSALGKAINDYELIQIAVNQIEWVLGYNPFSTSTMYGLGYNYHPLYVAFSKQMVGSLPVGFMTYGNNDAPYWPVKNNAVYKEIWGHTSGKFLWVIADILEMENKNGK